MATKTAKKPVEVVDHDAALLAAVPELLQTRDDSMTIREWIVSLIPFFEKARALEVAAKARLASARTLTLPTNGEQDSAIQVFIRNASAENKIVEDHWKITALLHNFQRRLVTARKRATDALEEAAGMAQRLHNQYDDMEHRRVEEENRRRQREADEQARRDREAELARLEQQALDAEAASAELGFREQKFVDYITGPYPDPQRAAFHAGYKDASYHARLLQMPKIVAAIKAKREAIALRQQAEAKKAAPVVPADVHQEKPDVGRAGSDRTFKSGDIFNERLFVEAVIGGQHAIPADCLMPNPVKVNEYARSMGELINRWPGCRLKKRTTTV